MYKIETAAPDRVRQFRSRQDFLPGWHTQQIGDDSRNVFCAELILRLHELGKLFLRDAVTDEMRFAMQNIGGICVVNF